MSKHSESQIVEIEERLRQAMLVSDVAELDALIAPELIFTSFQGHLVSKEQDLAMHRSGLFKFRSLTPTDRQMQFNDGFTVVSVKMHILSIYEGVEIDQSYRFTRIWATSSLGTLQIVAGHVGVVSDC